MTAEQEKAVEVISRLSAAELEARLLALHEESARLRPLWIAARRAERRRQRAEERGGKRAS